MNSTTQAPGDADARAAAAGFIDARARREFGAMLIATFLFSVTHNYSALLAIVFEDSGHSLQATGMLLSLFALPAIAGALLSSASCARFGTLVTARWAIGLTCIGMASFALTRESFMLALASRFVQGLGVGAMVPAGMVYIQSRLNRTRFVYLVTFYSAVVPLAAAFAPPIGEWTLARFGETALFIEAGIPAGIGVALLFGMRDAPRPRETRGLALSGGFRARLILPYIIVLAGGGLYGFSVNYLAADLQQRAIALAAFFIPSSVALIAIRFVGMRALAALSPRLLIMLSLSSYALGYLLIVIAPGALVMAVGGIFFGLGNSIMFPVISAWIGEGLSPEERPAPQAVATASFYVGIYALPWPQTFLISAGGYAAPEWMWFAIAAVLTLVLAIGRLIGRIV